MRVIAKLHSLLLLSAKNNSSSHSHRSITSTAPLPHRSSSTTTTTTTTTIMATSNTPTPWTANDQNQAIEAKELGVWPLDESNAVLLNEVHPRGYVQSVAAQETHEIYDLLVIGAGAGGLVSSRQAARRGAKSGMITEHLAGGDCLNVGCVPSKALLRAAKSIAEVKKCAAFGVILPPGEIKLDFSKVMLYLREKRAHISPADGHLAGVRVGAHVFQGRGKFVGPDSIRVGETVLKFKKAVVAVGGRPGVPSIPGLKQAPFTTNESLFNLEVLPPRMVIIGAGVIALEMAQCFAAFGTHVTVLQRSNALFASKQGDPEAAKIIQEELEKSGVHFLSGSTKQVTTLRERTDDTKELPLMKLSIGTDNGDVDLECECLLVATGRVANVENLGLEEAGIEYEVGTGVKCNDLSQSVSNPNVYAVGDCVAGVPRLTHMSGEMAKQVVQNALFGDDWKYSSMVVPAVAYTEPEYGTVGIYSAELAEKKGLKVDTYRAGLEHNDRAILESSNVGFCKIFCKQGTDDIVGATIVAERAGEMINEVSLAMKHNIGLRGIGRNIHAYPTTGEAVMGCGIQYINSHWERLD